MKNQGYPSKLMELLDETKREKIIKFYGLLAEGKEIHYDPFQDRLYSDLNLTLTDKHLAMAMLRYLDLEIAETAEKIMSNKTRSKRSRVLSVAKLVAGKTIPELLEASEKAARDVNVYENFVEELKNLKPTRLTIWTDTPRQTVDFFKEMKLNPVYNSSGEHLFITVYATELGQKDGLLTGEVSYIPDEIERHNIQTLEHLAFLKKNMDILA